MCTCKTLQLKKKLLLRKCLESFDTGNRGKLKKVSVLGQKTLLINGKMCSSIFYQKQEKSSNVAIKDSKHRVETLEYPMAAKVGTTGCMDVHWGCVTL